MTMDPLGAWKLIVRCAVAAVLAAAAATPSAAHDVQDDVARIAVVSAFAPELSILRDELSGAVVHSLNGVQFVTGTLQERDVVLFLSGISVVNAAMTAQLALDHFNIERIVFSGIAGGVDPALHIGDVVIADRWGQYLELVFAREVESGWQTPPFFDYPYAAEDTCLRQDPRIVVGGPGVSGGAFIDNAAFREYAFATFGARVLDMESAAVAHVAYANRVPFLALRSLSDLAGGGEGETQMQTFLGLAAGNAAAVVKALLRALPD